MDKHSSKPLQGPTLQKEEGSIATYERDYDNHIMDLKLKKIYPKLVNATLLDIGCGETRGVYRRIGRVLKKYVGLDKDLPSKEIMAENEQYDSCYFCDFESEEKFDVILLFGTIEEVPDEIQHLIEAQKFLKEKGSIFISFPNPYALNRVMGACNGYIESPEDLDIHDMKQGHLRLPTPEKITEWAKKAGLSVISKWPMGFKPLPMSEMKNLTKYWHQFDMMMEKGETYGITKFCAGWMMELTNN